MVTLVTGGTGFVGSNIVRTLAHALVAACREGASQRNLP